MCPRPQTNSFPRQLRPAVAANPVEHNYSSDTSGHSPDSVSLILDEGIAFTGDLPPLRMVPDDPTDLARQSWEKIHAKGVTTVYPAHGPTWRLT